MGQASVTLRAGRPPERAPCQSEARPDQRGHTEPEPLTRWAHHDTGRSQACPSLGLRSTPDSAHLPSRKNQSRSLKQKCWAATATRAV